MRVVLLPYNDGVVMTEDFTAPCAPTLQRPGDFVIAVVGPTASGKSDLALDLASALPEFLESGAGEIVSADAFQLYRGMDIGTAKTPLEERRGIPHHQIDVLNVKEEASVARYQQAARADLADIRGRGGLGVVAGGSGLYQRALLDVIDFPGTDPRVRAALEAEAEGPSGSRGLHARLESFDPVSASRIDPHNTRRIIRALEVIELTGRPYSSNMPERLFQRPSIMLAIRHDLEVLDERIRIRTARMFTDGLIEETRELMKAGLEEGRTARRATGYAEAIAVVKGEMNEDEAQNCVELATRQLARRQIKWLRPDPRVFWLEADDPAPLKDRAVALVREAVDAAMERGAVEVAEGDARQE